jgi:hypothetical protein
MSNNSDSSAIALLKLICDSCCDNGGHSWAVVNKAMGDGLRIAISGRFDFALEDFKNLSQTLDPYAPNGRLGFWRWIGKDTEHWHGESFYKLAIDSGNLSAYQSMEFWMDRKPFIVNGKRLGVGSSFYVEGYSWWTVGSFSKDGKKINLHSGSLRKALTAKELKAFAKGDFKNAVTTTNAQPNF